MSGPPKETPEKEKAYLAKQEKRDQYATHIVRRILHVLEYIVAAVTIVALVLSLAREVLHMATEPGYFADLSTFLHHILTIVVGLEFVRMIIDVTPASTLEVLTVAITRHVILNHDDPWSNLACIVCIAGLFATRRFLVRRTELKEELVETD